MAKSLKAVSGLKVTRSTKYAENGGIKFIASWKKVNTSKNSAVKLNAQWVFTDKKGKNKVVEKSHSISKTTHNHTIQWSEYKDSPVTKVVFTIWTVDSNGKKEKASKTIKFAIPDKPVITLSYDATKGVNCKIASKDDQAFDDKGKKICTHIQYELLRQGKTLVSTTLVRSPTGVNKTDDYPNPIPASGYVEYKARAKSIGIAGNTGYTNYKSLYLSRPNAPTISSISEVSRGVHRVNFKLNNTKEHPVDSVELRYADIDQNVDPQTVAWSNATTAQETFSDGVTHMITKDLGDVEAKKKRYFCVVPKHFIADNQSNLKCAKYGKPEAPANIRFGSTTTAANIAWDLPGVIDPSAKICVYAESKSGKKETKELSATATEYTFTKISDKSSYIYGVYVKAGKDGAKSVTSDTIKLEPPKAPNKPTNVTATQFDTYDGATITWVNGKISSSNVFVDGCEVAWSEDAFAWESNNPPNTYEFEMPNVTSIRITELAAGNRYFFWVRTYDLAVDGTKNYSPWSDLTEASNCTMSDIPSTPMLTLSRSWAKTDTETILATWDYSSIGSSPLKSSTIDVRFNGKSVHHKDLGAGVLSYELPVSTFATDLGTYAVSVSVANTAAASSSLKSNLEIVSEPVVAIAESKDAEDPKFVVITEDNEEETHLIKGKPKFLVTGPIDSLADKSLIISVAETPTAIEMPYGSYHAYSGDIVFSTFVEFGKVDGEEGETSVENTSAIIEIPEDTPFIDGVKYVAQVSAVDTNTLLQSDPLDKASMFEFTVDWARKAIEPVVDDYTVEIKRNEDNAVYAELSPIAPAGSSETDVCDVYRVTADGYVKCLEGVKFGQVYRDYYPVYGWDKCAYRFVTRTTEGSLDWADAPYRFDNSNVTLDWGDSVELKWNVNSTDNRAKNFEARTHMGSSKALYFTKGINRTANITSQLVRDLDDEKIEALYALSRHEGVVMIRFPYGIGYMGNVDVSIDSSFGSPVVDVKLDITETDGDGMFMAEKVE